MPATFPSHSQKLKNSRALRPGRIALLGVEELLELAHVGGADEFVERLVEVRDVELAVEVEARRARRVRLRAEDIEAALIRQELDGTLPVSSEDDHEADEG